MPACTLYAMEDKIDYPIGSDTAGDLRHAFFDHLVRCETRLYNAASEALRNANGISAGQFEFLRHLRQVPQARVADLAATFAVGIGATSKGIDRLEASGLVRRVANPSDRRSSLLELTLAGEQLLDAAEETFERALTELLAPVGDDEIGLISPVLQTLRKALESSGAGSPAG